MTTEIDGSKPWVLIVDDDEDNRELLAEFLAVADYATLSCGAASEAEKILDSQPPPCLVISDVRMPDMDGRTFVANLRARAGFEETPVIFGYFYDYLTATAKGVTGVQPTAMSQLFLDKASKA
jgi:CheY-like chemotaxis protein